ncbi:MAG TPA: hypothetical protein VL961_00630 [Acidimicrobiales bacterium]|nr:hypothetical protein [Acidimicrobiales bacterium]
MSCLDAVMLEVGDPQEARTFYDAAFGLGDRLRLRRADAPTEGFRGFTVSLVVGQPAIVDDVVAAALDAGASSCKGVAKSFWGYGGVVAAPDGTIWKVATSAKRNSGEASRKIDEMVVLLGVDDVLASKRFYVEQGLKVAKSFGRKYVQFDTGSAPLTLALYGRKALAKDAGVPEPGTGSHRLALIGDRGPLTDPDGFGWEAARAGATEA